jgi:hypothetical protein
MQRPAALLVAPECSTIGEISRFAILINDEVRFVNVLCDDVCDGDGRSNSPEE